MSLFALISNLLNPPAQDPKRFANAVPYVPNFKGELVGMKRKGTVNDRVQVEEDGTVTFFDQTGFSGMNITGNLTKRDTEGLKKKNLDPTNPAYQKAKTYFAAHPSCDKKDLANAAGIGVETAKDVIAIFRKNI